MEEVKYQLLLSRDLNYIDLKTYDEIFDIADEVGKLLNGLIKKINV